MRSDVDLLALDGHGWINGGNAYFGTDTNVHVNPCALRGEQDQGITAPVVIFGFCCGATEPFLDAVAEAIDRPEVAFVGCAGTAKRNEAHHVYPRVLALLDTLGANPDPAEAHARIKPHEPAFGRPWRTTLLQRSKPAR